jgi:hypothetical protein
MARKVTVEVIRTLLIALFLYAALSKILDEHYLIKLSRSPLIAGKTVVIAWLLPMSEIITVLLLLFNRTLFLGLISSLMLMITFTVYVCMILNYPQALCTCGGLFEKMSWISHLIFNISTIICILIAIFLLSKPRERQEHHMISGMASPE